MARREKKPAANPHPLRTLLLLTSIAALLLYGTAQFIGRSEGFRQMTADRIAKITGTEVTLYHARLTWTLGLELKNIALLDTADPLSDGIRAATVRWARIPVGMTTWKQSPLSATGLDVRFRQDADGGWKPASFAPLAEVLAQGLGVEAVPPSKPAVDSGAVRIGPDFFADRRMEIHNAQIALLDAAGTVQAEVREAHFNLYGFTAVERHIRLLKAGAGQVLPVGRGPVADLCLELLWTPEEVFLLDFKARRADGSLFSTTDVDVSRRTDTAQRIYENLQALVP